MKYKHILLYILYFIYLTIYKRYGNLNVKKKSKSTYHWQYIMNAIKYNERNQVIFGLTCHGQTILIQLRLEA